MVREPGAARTGEGAQHLTAAIGSGRFPRCGHRLALWTVPKFAERWKLKRD